MIRDFAHYQDAEAAHRVWNEYVGNRHVNQKFINAYEMCRNSQDLDFELDGLTSGHELSLGMDGPRVCDFIDSDEVPFEDMARNKYTGPDIWKVALSHPQ